MADLISMLSACGATEGEATDEYFQNTTLLLHGDGTNGAQNNTFLDSSTNNFTITRNGNTTQGSFSPFSKPDGRFGAFFPATSGSTQQQITGTLSSAFGTGNFTVDFWLYFVSAQSIAQILDMRSGGDGLLVQIYDNNRLEVASSAGTVIAAAAGTAVTPNTWVHVAVVRSGTGSGQVALYINGSSVGTGTSSTNLTSNTVSIGSRYTDSGGVWNPLNGYLSNFRISNTNRTITVPTAPYTSDANTLLLTCQSNRFIDNSSNAIALTLGGTTPRITPFSPFPITTAYDPAVNGGSGYFDGSGDYLSVPDNAAIQLDNSTAFTIECWIYFNAFANQNILRKIQTLSPFAGYGLATGEGGAATNTLVFFVGGTGYTTVKTGLVTGQWYHFAATYEGSGTTLRLFLDGVQQGSAITCTSGILNTTQNLHISGTNDSPPTNHFTGYVSGLRIVKGSAVWTSGFTVPTSPPTAVANTSLLTNFTNAGIFDNTGFNNLETVGNAQIDTSVKKYGTGSMEFDGTGDVLLFPASPQLYFGSGNYTVEMWIYINSFATTAQQVAYSSGSVSGDNLYLSVTATSIIIGNQSVATLTASTTINTSTWYHIAACRSGTTLRIFKDGTQVGTTTDSKTWISDGVAGVGAYSPNNALAINGYIDDLRITKGVARYTTTFTPPTAAFPDIGE